MSAQRPVAKLMALRRDPVKSHSGKAAIIARGMVRGNRLERRKFIVFIYFAVIIPM